MKIRVLDQSGTEIDAPREWEPGFVEVAADPVAWQDVRLTVQGTALAVSLRKIGGRARIIAEWPRANPGRYRLVLHLGDERQELVTSIAPRKISQDAFAEMLADLECRLPIVIALGLQRASGMAGLKLPPPGQSTIQQEIVRLRRALEGTESRAGLLAVLRELASDPHVMLRHHEHWVHAERARRPHPSRLAQALAQPHNFDAEQRAIRLLDNRVEQSVDTYENRLVKLFTEQVERRLRRLIRLLNGMQAPVELAEMEELHRRLRLASRRAAFLDEVATPVFPPDRTTMVLLKRPPYLAALTGYHELHRTVAVRLEDAALESPLENLPYLYQRWGTLLVLAALLDCREAQGFAVTSQRLVQKDAEGVFVRLLADGKPALELHRPIDGATVRFIPERTYGSGGAIRSVSFPQRPDIVIEITRPGQPAQVLIFDPKYKLDGELVGGTYLDGKPKKVDIDKMHAYRDAIRDSALNCVVSRAALLYPGPDVEYKTGIAALRAYPGDTDGLQAQLTSLFHNLLD